jgi:hypothetical protein
MRFGKAMVSATLQQSFSGIYLEGLLEAIIRAITRIKRIDV